MNIVRMLLCLVALTPGVALSEDHRGDRDRNGGHHDRNDRRDNDRRDNDRREQPRRRGIPEFDPATAGAIAAVIAGGGVMLARRRAKK